MLPNPILSVAYKHTLRAIRPPAGLHSEITVLLYAMKGRDRIGGGGGERAGGAVSPGDCLVVGSENKTELEVSEGCDIDQPLSLAARDAPIADPALSPFLYFDLDGLSSVSTCTTEASVVWCTERTEEFVKGTCVASSNSSNTESDEEFFRFG
jgi:hypothetical protein